MNYGIGMLHGRGQGSPFIARWDEHESFDQTDLEVWLRCILGFVGGSFQKLRARRCSGRPDDTPLGPPGPLLWPNGPIFGDLHSSAF
jgi:hypothetical protein